MKTNHTKGKWLISPPWSVHTDDGMMIADCGRSHVLPDRQMTANTRLIAAAPDMLAALEQYLSAGSKEARRAASVVAKAAISKAKGEA
jgi:hypothetical protein